MKILSIHWPLVLIVTIGLYALIILTLPFNATMATIFLFTIIGLWSRLPGVGIIHPFFILYQADVIDIFMLLIAIHVSPIHAVLFSIFCNLVSRSAGIYPGWLGVFKDTAILSINALIAPITYSLSGGNIIVVIGVYSVLRIIMFVIAHLIIPYCSVPQMLISEAGAFVAIFLINMFYAKLFGSFFENLLQGGVVFNWLLFMLVTVVIIFIMITVFGLSPKKVSKRIVKRVSEVSRASFRQAKVEDTSNNYNEMEQFDDIKGVI